MEKVFYWRKFLAFESQKFLSLKGLVEAYKAVKLEFDAKIHCEINAKCFMKWKEKPQNVSFPNDLLRYF